MQSVPSHFSTCTNTRDLETLHKFLLTSYRQSLNGLKRANSLGDNTSIYQGDLKCSLQHNLPSLGSDKGAAAVPAEPARRKELFQQPPALCQAAPGQKPTERDTALHTGSEKP